MQRIVWKYYLDFYKQYKLKILFCVLLSVIQTALILPIVFIVRYIFDKLIPQGDFPHLIWIGLILLALSFTSSATNLWSRHFALKTTKSVITAIREKLILKIFRVSRSFLTKNQNSELHASVVQDTQRIDIMSNAILSQVLPQLVILVILGFVLLYLNWFLFLLVLVVAPFLFLLKRFLRKKQIKRIKLYHRTFEKFSKGIMFILQKMDLIRMQSAEETEFGEQKKRINNLLISSYRMAWLNSAYLQAQNGITVLVGVLILVAGGIAVGKDTLTLGGLLAFYVALSKMSSSLSIIFSTLPALLEGNQSLITLHNFIKEPDNQDYVGSKEISFKGKLTFNKVHFSYGEKEILSEISFSIEPSSITAILGSNGAGKSTIVNLILGFYKPQKGNLLADGIHYNKLSIRDFRKQIGIVAQNQILFPGTILENLNYGSDNYSDESVIEACTKATAWEFIEMLPLQLNTQIGENGALLSGGQIQRILIARAILRKPRLLILDEPTNHLDPASRDLLIKNLTELDFQPTILIISQSFEDKDILDNCFLLSEDSKLKNLLIDE